MPVGRPTVFSQDLVSKIADCFLVAFTDEQTAEFCGISSKTIQRLRRDPTYCPAVKYAELEREMRYRKKIWAAKGYWQGAAWFLERKYPTQFAKPEVQFQINNNSVTNNNLALVITAEVAGKIGSRMKSSNTEIDKLFKDKKNGHANGNGHKTIDI